MRRHVHRSACALTLRFTLLVGVLVTNAAALGAQRAVVPRLSRSPVSMVRLPPLARFALAPTGGVHRPGATGPAASVPRHPD